MPRNVRSIGADVDRNVNEVDRNVRNDLGVLLPICELLLGWIPCLGDNAYWHLKTQLGKAGVGTGVCIGVCVYVCVSAVVGVGRGAVVEDWMTMYWDDWGSEASEWRPQRTWLDDEYSYKLHHTYVATVGCACGRGYGCVQRQSYPRIRIATHVSRINNAHVLFVCDKIMKT